MEGAFGSNGIDLKVQAKPDFECTTDPNVKVVFENDHEGN